MAIKRVLTGMRTTGELHLGHYLGALKQWLEVQDSGKYECFFLLADMQALTTHASNPSILEKSVRDVVLDWLSVGLNPDPNIHFVLQSQVPERHELSLIFQMIAGYKEVLGNPTLKAELKLIDNATIGFMTYPVDQVADIEMVCPYPASPGDELLVPVGEDQIPHLEYARVLARRFNKQYGPLFVPCEPLVGKIGRLVGTDGKAKMSKSLGNTINLSASRKEVEAQVMRMYTDPKRIRADIPGDTTDNPIFIYHRAFNPDKEEVKDLTHRYRRGKVGDVEVKKRLADAINNFLEPIRDRRARLSQTDIREILVSGSNAARRACQPIVAEARERMFLRFPT